MAVPSEVASGQRHGPKPSLGRTDDVLGLEDPRPCRAVPTSRCCSRARQSRPLVHRGRRQRHPRTRGCPIPAEARGRDGEAAFRPAQENRASSRTGATTGPAVVPVHRSNEVLTVVAIEVPRRDAVDDPFGRDTRVRRTVVHRRGETHGPRRGFTAGKGSGALARRPIGSAYGRRPAREPEEAGHGGKDGRRDGAAGPRPWPPGLRGPPSPALTCADHELPPLAFYHSPRKRPSGFRGLSRRR